MPFIDDQEAEAAIRAAYGATYEWHQGYGSYHNHSWDGLDEWQRQSLREARQFYIDNPDATPRDAHEAYCRHREALGWSASKTNEDGHAIDRFDPHEKVNPGLAAWADLPREWKMPYVLVMINVRGVADADRYL